MKMFQRIDMKVCETNIFEKSSLVIGCVKSNMPVCE